VSQTPDVQSPEPLQELAQLPVLSHLYGAHDCGGPASPEGIDEVPSAEQVAGGLVAHLPFVQMKLGWQSPSLAQVVRHFVASAQPKLPEHGLAVRHVPAPSHV
jgi:hypothetical protein